MSADVVVLGGGLAGSLAALTVAEKRPDASVHLVEPDEERFRRHDGLIDVLGYVEDVDGPVSRPLEHIPSLPASHPYRRVGVESVERGLERFESVVGEAYGGGGTEQNALVPTCGGMARPTARYPTAVENGLLSEERDVLLVGFERILDFDAYLASRRLSATLPYDVGGLSTSFPLAIDAAPAPQRYARALDANEETADGRPIREALTDTLRRFLDVEPRVGLPAMVGIEHHDEIRSTLEDQLHVRLFEVSIGPPSVPGVRLGGLVQDSLEAASVRTWLGEPVVDASVDGNRVQSVTVGREGSSELDATEFLLATGGVGTGGLEARREGIREPHFDCHVSHPSGRAEWMARDPLSPQPFARFGVRVDDRLRPLEAGGNPQYENLRAAGTILGGHDYVAQHARDGVAIATGFEAGERIADSL